MDDNKKIHIYWEYRKQGMLLNDTLLDSMSHEDIEKCASLFDLIDESGAFYFDNKSDQDQLMDFAIHDYQENNGGNAIQKFADSNRYKSLLKPEKEILDAKINSIQSLFLVDYTKPAENILGLKDVFNSYQNIEIIDTSLSDHLAPKKKYIFTRIMQFNDFSCTTGVAYIFNKDKYNKIKNAYLKQLKHYSYLNSRTRKAVAFFYVNKKYGLPVIYGSKK